MPLPANAINVVAAINAVVTQQEGAGFCFLMRRVSARSLSGFPPGAPVSPVVPNAIGLKCKVSTRSC